MRSADLRFLLPLLAIPITCAAPRDVTFISVSDPHYREPDHRAGCHNDLTRATIDEIDRIAGIPWPEKTGGGSIGKPRGVVLLGDVIDDGDRAEKGRNLSAEQFRLFEADFGLDGKDGRLKLPVFETWGNHDGPPLGREKRGFSFQGELKKRNARRLAAGLISNLSENGLHYSWDWDDVHFVSLGIYPADRQHAGVRYSAQWHDPQNALAFLREDLAKKVGSSGRPVVLMAHCGFDTDWWCADDWAVFYQAVRDYRVVLYLYGHTGTGVSAWAPAGADRKLTTINDGHADIGFFVIHLGPDRLRAAYRVKSAVRSAKAPDGRMVHEWGGRWEWKWPLDQPLTPNPDGPATIRTP